MNCQSGWMMSNAMRHSLSAALKGGMVVGVGGFEPADLTLIKRPLYP